MLSHAEHGHMSSGSIFRCYFQYLTTILIETGLAESFDCKEFGLALWNSRGYLEQCALVHDYICRQFVGDTMVPAPLLKPVAECLIYCGLSRTALCNLLQPFSCNAAVGEQDFGPYLRYRSTENPSAIIDSSVLHTVSSEMSASSAASLSLFFAALLSISKS